MDWAWVYPFDPIKTPEDDPVKDADNAAEEEEGETGEETEISETQP